jgi:ABC-2 type transport system permease protein
MRIYWETFKFNCLQDFAYPLEIVAFVIRKLISLGFLVLFWFVISKSNTSVFDFRQILSYFLIASAVEDLTNTSTGGWDRDIRHKIKQGLLSNYLIKPINILRFWYVSFMGKRVSISIYAIICLFVGVNIYPHSSLGGMFLFPVSLVLTAATGAGLNLLVGIMAFYSPEAGNFANVVDHISNIFSGHLIPLNYFPTMLRNIAFLTPFPILTFFPVSILQQGDFNGETFYKLGLSLFWAVTLLVLGNIAWKRALKNYDGVGI